MAKGASLRAVLYVKRWAPQCIVGGGNRLMFPRNSCPVEADRDWRALTADEKNECHILWDEESKRRVADGGH